MVSPFYLVVLARWFTNSTPPLLTRAIRAYRALDLTTQPRHCPPRSRPKRAIQLNSVQLARLVTGYRAGATVYELAAEFGITRATVSAHLKRRGIQTRRRPPSTEAIDEMVRLYEQGLSMVRVGDRTGVTAGTVMKYLRVRGVQARDSHGSKRSPEV